MSGERTRRMRGSSREVEEAALEMRRAMTPAEAALWQALRDRGCAGLKFRRQQARDRFVPDFYCASARLVVEVDGGVHDEPAQIERDAERTQMLARLGIRVLRVTNEEVMEDLAGVLRRIRAAAGVEEEEA